MDCWRRPSSFLFFVMLKLLWLSSPLEASSMNLPAQGKHKHTPYNHTHIHIFTYFLKESSSSDASVINRKVWSFCNILNVIHMGSFHFLEFHQLQYLAKSWVLFIWVCVVINHAYVQLGFVESSEFLWRSLSVGVCLCKKPENPNPVSSFGDLWVWVCVFVRNQISEVVCFRNRIFVDLRGGQKIFSRMEVACVCIKHVCTHIYYMLLRPLQFLSFEMGCSARISILI